MSLGIARAALADGFKGLRQAWKRCRREWDDEVAQRFEDEFLEPLGPNLKSASDAFDAMKAMVERAERECGP